MALDFSTSGSRVDHGSGASIDDLHGGTFTYLAWVYRTGTGADQEIITKDASFPDGALFAVDAITVEGQLRLFVPRNIVNIDVYSSGTVVAADTWTIVACTYNLSASPIGKLYTGTLTSAMAEVSYGLQENGSGSLTGDDAANLYVGSVQRDTTKTFKGRIAGVAVYNRVLTLAELQAHQFDWTPRSGCVLLTDYHGTGIQADLSGNGNNGTVTTATVADHVPIRSAASRRVLPYAPYVAAAAAVVAGRAPGRFALLGIS
jgi:hypothetical protein